MRAKHDLGSIMSMLCTAAPKPPERWGRAGCKVCCYPIRDHIEASGKIGAKCASHRNKHITEII